MLRDVFIFEETEMTREIELCRSCRQAYEVAWTLVPLSTEAYRKAICENCERRMYVTKYRLEGRREKT